MSTQNRQHVWHQCGQLATILAPTDYDSPQGPSAITGYRSYVHPLDLRISADRSTAHPQVMRCCNPDCCQMCMGAIEEQYEGLSKEVNDLVRSGENIGPGEMERLVERLRIAGTVRKRERDRHMKC